MTWSIYADPYGSGELSSPVKSQEILFHNNLQIKAIRTWVVLYGNPTYTNLKMKLYENNADGNVPSSIVRAESLNSWNPTDLLTSEPYGYKEIYFEFTPFGVNGNDRYHIALEADSYSPTANSYMAWSNAWPNPVYNLNFTATSNNFISTPYIISAVIGSRS